MKPKYRFIVRNRFTALALLVPALAQPLSAASIFWGNSGTDFNAGASWIGGTAPVSVDIASFAGAKVTDPALGSPAAVRGLAFTNAAASSYTFTGSALTLGRGGINAAAVTSGTNTISTPLTLAAGGQSWSSGTGSTLAVNGTVTRNPGAAVTIDKSAATGTISSTSLTNTNGIVGAWASVRSAGTAANNAPEGDTYATVSGGNLVPYTGATPFTGIIGVLGGVPSGGSGNVNYDVNGSGTFSAYGLVRNINTIRYTGAGGTQPSNVNPSGNLLTLNGLMNAGTGTLNIGGTGGTDNYGINITVGASNDLVLSAKTAGITLRGIILDGTAPGALTIDGNQTVTLTNSTTTAASTYTGPTTIAGGTLQVGGTASINTTSGITVNGANAKYLHTSSTASTRNLTLTNGTLDGTGTIGAVTVADNTGSIVTHGNGATTPLTVGSLTFNGKATVKLNRGASVPLAVTGALATTPANGQVVLDVTNALPNGLIDLVSFGSFTGSASDFTASFTGLNARQFAGTPQLNGNNIAVNISGETVVWTGADSGDWFTSDNGDDSNPNWARKSAKTGTNFWAGDSVEFNDTYDLGAGPVAVTETDIFIDFGNVAPASTTFNNSNVDYLIDSIAYGIGGTGSLVKNGTGTVTLITPNTYTGTTTINGGTLELGDGAIDGTIANTAAVINNATLVYNWFDNRTAAYPISGTGTLVKENLGNLTLTGANTSTGATTITEGTVTLAGDGGLGSGALSVASGALLDVTKTITLGQTTTGAGTIRNTAGSTTLTGNNSGFTGVFQHASAGSSTLLGATTAASANAAYEITVGNTISQGILALTLTGDNTFTLGSLSGVTNSLVRNGGAVTGSNTFQIGNLGTDTTFAGIFGGGGGTLGLTKVGTGTLTMSGPCTYNGATNINQGTLSFTTTAQNIASTAFTVADGATLRVTAPAAGTTLLTTGGLTLGSTGSPAVTFNLNNLNPTVPQISTGALAINGSVAINLLNANALATGTYKLIDYTSISGSGSLPGGSFPVGNRGTASIVINAVDTSIDLVVSSDTPVWTGLDNGNWTVGATGANKNWKLASSGTAVDFLNNDLVTFDDSAAGTTNIVVNTAVQPLGTTFNHSTKTYTVSGTAGIAAGSLVKSGTGTTTLLTTNTYPGATTINGGTLRLGDGTTDGTIAATSGVTNNGTLAYNWAGDHTAPYPVSGGGALTKAGAGVLTLTGANTYTGGSTISGGTVTLAGNGSLGTGNIAVGAGTTLNIDKSLALTNTVTGAGAIVNTFTLTNTGDFSGFSGTFTHNSATQSVAFNAAAATSQNAAYHIATEQGSSQGMLAGANGDYTLRLGSLSGVAGSLFRGGNTVTGTTTLEIGNLGTSTEFAGSINNGATKTLALTKVGGGTLTLSGASGYTGSTLVLGGTLQVNGSLAAASTVTVGGGTTLSGGGTVAGTVVGGGTIAPGNGGAGTLTTGPVTLSGTLAVQVDGAAGDKLLSTGAINLSGASLTVALLGGGFTEGSYVIAEGTSITGGFASVPSGYNVSIIAGGAGQQAVLTTTGGGGYSSWAATNAGGQTPDLDFNNDGVDNGIAYFMNNGGRITLPGVSGGAVTWTNGGNIPASAYGTQFVVQTSANLSSWTTVPVGNLTTNTNSTLTYTLPTGAGKVFVRLAVDPD